MCESLLPAIKIKVLSPPEALLEHGRAHINLYDHQDRLCLVHLLSHFLVINPIVLAGGAVIL